jgi:hypothetical protein
MGKIGKAFALFLTLVTAMLCVTLLTVKPATAQSTGILSAPAFSVILTNASYSVPPVYYTDPQTGANITKAGYFVNQENLTFTIQNEPNVTYYVIRWTTPYIRGWNSIEGYFGGDPMNATIKRTTGSTTNWVLTGTNGSFPIYEHGILVDTVVGYSFSFGFQSLNFESGAKIEFQVQASNGTPVYNSTILEERYSIIGEPSDWSNTQTITIPGSSISPLPSPTPTPASTVPEFPTWMIPPLFAAVTLVSIVFIRKRMTKT